MRSFRTVIGVLAWLGGGLLLAWQASGLDEQQRASSERFASELWEYATAERRVVRLRWTDDLPIRVGDPIYRIDGPDSIVPVGEVRQVFQAPPPPDAPSTTEAMALLYPAAPQLAAESHLTYYATPTSMNWVVETMLPPEKQAQIRAEIIAAYETYHTEIIEVLKPVLMAGLQDALRVVQEDLGLAIERHRGELETLGNRYQQELFEQEIVPLVRQVIWPIVRRHAEPLANRVGLEMWERASVWRFGWRYLYDISFLPEKDLTRTEWQRFVREEALPVLDTHGEEFVSVQRRILLEIAQDEQVREALRRNLSHVMDDREFHAILWRMLREVLIDNPRLRETLEARWQSEEAQWAFQLAGYRIESSIRRIGDLLLGTREEGISPEFAQVLRNQILDKDCRWLVLEGASPAPDPAPDWRTLVLPVQRGQDPDINPFGVQLRSQD